MEIKAHFDRWPENHHPLVTRIFRQGLYLWVMLNFLWISPIASAIWGSDVVFTKNWLPLSSGLMFALFPSLHEIASIFVFLPVLLAAAGLYWWRSRWPAIVICYVVLSFYDVARFSLDGGHNLSWLLLVYNIFLDPRPDAPALAKFVSMCGFITCRAQIVLIYLTAGITKMLAPVWQEGEALYYVLALDVFSFPWMQEWVATAPVVLLKILSYFIIAFQIAFPLLIWSKRLRPWLLVVGVCVYAGIMLVMGLGTFGLIMILAHVLFLDEDSRMVRKIGQPL